MVHETQDWLLLAIAAAHMRSGRSCKRETSFDTKQSFRRDKFRRIQKKMAAGFDHVYPKLLPTPSPSKEQVTINMDR